MNLLMVSLGLLAAVMGCLFVLVVILAQRYSYSNKGPDVMACFCAVICFLISVMLITPRQETLVALVLAR